MSPENNLTQKLFSRYQKENHSPTPCQVQRQIEKNRENQEKLSELKEELDLKSFHFPFDALTNKGPEFIANLKASLEQIKTHPDGEILISLIDAKEIHSDGTIKIKELKKKI